MGMLCGQKLSTLESVLCRNQWRTMVWTMAGGGVMCVMSGYTTSHIVMARCKLRAQQQLFVQTKMGEAV